MRRAGIVFMGVISGRTDSATETTPQRSAASILPADADWSYDRDARCRSVGTAMGEWLADAGLGSMGVAHCMPCS